MELESALSDSSQTSDELKALQDAVAHYKRGSARLEAERGRLAAEEADAAQDLGVEQGRWSDINGKVEEAVRRQDDSQTTSAPFRQPCQRLFSRLPDMRLWIVQQRSHRCSC